MAAVMSGSMARMSAVTVAVMTVDAELSVVH